MSDVRCPMCDKSNPGDLEVCQFCEARLMPLVGSPAEEDATEDLQAREPDDERLIPDGSPGSGVNLTDWLQSLRVDGDDTPSSSPAEEDSPAWLAGEGVESQGEGDFRKDEGENDWLSNLRQEGDATGDLSYGPDEPGKGWFAPESPAEDLPAWLSATEDEPTENGTFDTPEPKAADSVEEPEIEDSETPEWLRKVRARQVAEDIDDAPVVSSTGQESDDVPFWMEESKEPSSEDDQQESDTIDWLSDLSGESTDLGSDLIEDVTGSDTGDLAEDSEEKVEAISPPPITEKDDVPDWISKFDREEVDQVIKSELSSEEVPEWLSKLEEAAGIEHQPIESTLEETPPIDVSTFDDRDLDEHPIQVDDEELAIEGEVQSIPPFNLDDVTESVPEEDISDLLADIPDEEMALEEDELPNEDDDLVPAELPGWLEAMRPVESAAPLVPTVDENDKQVEGGGPLAGLRGVLPAEPEIAHLKKPTVYTSKLQISENHRLHATILNELIKNEKRAQPLPSNPVLSSQQILRWSIFALLSIAVLWYVFTGSQNMPLPASSTSVMDVSNIINALPENSPVLLAVDYEPGISGEMDAASAGVMDHLMIKGSYLTLVSTAVTGPAQAERLVNNVNSSMGHQYQNPEQYTNLGYIPGGAIGLSGFSEAPRQVLPYSLDGELAWDSSALSGIQSLADFMLVMVITESPDTARTWIEQVQPVLDETPLLMVISAQAEPMVLPYYRGTPQQVQGIVAGLAGGAAYESGLPRTNLGRIYWDAYSFTVWLAVLLILVGGAITLAASQIANRKQAKGDGGS